jgi:hypothetical protein
VLELEDRAVAVLDGDGRAGRGRQLGEEEVEAAVDQAGGEVSQALAFDCGDQLPVQLDGVVADGQRAPLGAGLLAGEPVGVTLAGVDEDLQLVGGVADAAPGRPAGPARRCGRSARRLPVGRLAAG